MLKTLYKNNNITIYHTEDKNITLPSGILTKKGLEVTKFHNPHGYFCVDNMGHYVILTKQQAGELVMTAWNESNLTVEKIKASLPQEKPAEKVDKKDK